MLNSPKAETVAFGNRQHISKKIKSDWKMKTKEKNNDKIRR